jgi:dihydropteroate synthase
MAHRLMAVPGYRLMGILNVTPDSFSDGGLFLNKRAAIDHGIELVEQGADILDIGGESTRPGAEPVGVEEELRRVVPVVEGLAATRAPVPAPDLAAAVASVSPPGPAVAPESSRRTEISIDTSKAVVARAALAAGASLVNDVSALRADPAMAAVVAESGADCCLMHMLGSPRTMQREGGPRYKDVVDDVKAFLEERLAFAVGEGIAESRVLLDPGIGFGKTVAHNLELLRRLDELVALGRPLLVGTSRKSFLGVVVSPKRGAPRVCVRAREDTSAAPPKPQWSFAPEASERLPGTIATNVMAFERGASVFRVHDVAPVAAALAVAAATLSPRWTPTTS